MSLISFPSSSHPPLLPHAHHSTAPPFLSFTPSLSSPHQSPPPLHTLSLLPSCSQVPSSSLSLLSQLTNWIQFTPLQLLRVLKLLLAIFRNTTLFLDPYVRTFLASRYTGTIPNSVSSPAGATSLPASEIHSSQCKLPPSDRTFQPLACQTHGCRLPRRNHPVRLPSTSQGANIADI